MSHKSLRSGCNVVDQLQSIFSLFVWIFRRLENVSTPSFQMCHSILDCVSQVSFFLKSASEASWLNPVKSNDMIAMRTCPFPFADQVLRADVGFG